MKNTAKLICALFLLIYLSATFISKGQSNIRFGVTGGLNANQIKTSTNMSNLLWKYNVGFAFAKKLPGKYSLASELVYTRQGRHLELSRTRKFTTHFDYIAIPALVRFWPGEKDLYIQAGGKFSVLINSKEIYTNNNNTSLIDLDHLRQWDAGALGGVGYRLGSHMVVDFRYYFGMVPMIKKHTVLGPDLTPIFFGADRWFNRVWSLNLTYYL